MTTTTQQQPSAPPTIDPAQPFDPEALLRALRQIGEDPQIRWRRQVEDGEPIVERSFHRCIGNALSGEDLQARDAVYAWWSPSKNDDALMAHLRRLADIHMPEDMPATEAIYRLGLPA